MASVPEITQAYAAASRCKDLTFLKCTSAYPASIADANLATIPDVAEWLGCKAGLSDHSPGHEVAAAAAALGATYIEKHITLARADGGPDAGFSLEPAEFAAMVRAVRNAATARGRVHYGCTASESTTLRRSLYVVRDVAQGEPLVLGQNVRTARPAPGLTPSTVLDGKVARVPLTAGSPLIAEVIA
jgi:N-acetylneuraminate synthase